MRRGALAVLLTLAALSAGCTDDDGATPTADAAVDEDTGTTLDQSPFCVTIRELEQLGAAPAEGNGAPDEVLEQNAAIVELLEAAKGAAPADAPPDVHALFDDYLALSAAVTASGGDTDAAFASLQAEQPDLMTRLGAPDAHGEAFRWFSERCGTAPPT